MVLTGTIFSCRMGSTTEITNPPAGEQDEPRPHGDVRAGWGNARYHLLRADEFGAAEAHRTGLVQEVVAPGEQVERAIAVARELLQYAGLVHTIADARLALGQGEPAAIAAIPAMAAAVQPTADFREGSASFVERRTAQFTGR